MNAPTPGLVSDIRASSRELVRELGFMSRTIAGTGLAPSAVHAIVEIGAAQSMPAKALCEKLLLEKSTVSRLVGALVEKGVLLESRTQMDARSKDLSLTEKGNALLRDITQFAETRVSSALAVLHGPQRDSVQRGLALYASALRESRAEKPSECPPETPTINTGYVPGLAGRIVELHATYYSREIGFGAVFEAAVAGGLADFVPRLDKPANEIWSVASGGAILGSIAIDGEDLGSSRAHLRWYYLDPALRGTGTGRALLTAALNFCDRHAFGETHLWTIKGLDAARALYERHGFTLEEEYAGAQWGKQVIEQRFVRPHPTGP